MVGQLTAGKVRGRALIYLRQHGCVPRIPLRCNPVVNIFPARLQVGPLHGVIGDIEEKCVVEDLQIFKVTVSRGTLLIGPLPPERIALRANGAAF